MMLIKARSVILFSLLLLSFSLFVSTSRTTAATVLVPSGETFSTDVELNLEDEVSGRVSVVGGESSGINFTILGPSGQFILPPQTVTVIDFKFIAPEKGTHHFILDNSLSLVDKTVAINYDAKHYWFGLPQEVFLMIIIVLVGAFALIIYAIASKGQVL